MKNSEYNGNESLNLARDIVLEVNNKVKRTYWTNEEIDKYFGKRSAKEIINDGTTCYMNPCLDLTLVSASILFSKNINYKFVIEEHLPTPLFDFNRLHFVLEFENKNKTYTINYKKCNEVNIFEGKYNGREDIPGAQMISFPGFGLYPDKTIYENLGYKTIEKLIEEEFIGFSLKSNTNRLKQDNSKENFRKYKEAFGEEFKIILTPENQPSIVLFQDQFPRRL